MFTVAAGITDKTRKRALLLYQAGSRVREISGQLEATGIADDYDTAKKMLTEYFEPQKNRRYDVYTVFDRPTKSLMKRWISTILY